MRSGDMNETSNVTSKLSYPFETTSVMRAEGAEASKRRAEWVRSIMQDQNPDALVADDFADAFVGVSYRCGKESLAVYSVPRCIEILMKRDGTTHEGASEFFEFNVAGAWLGDGTPVWLYPEETD